MTRQPYRRRPETPRQLGSLRWLRLLLHEEDRLEPFPGASWIVAYPLVPWVAVMAAGYALGPWELLPREQRRARFFRAGAALISGFVLPEDLRRNAAAIALLAYVLAER
jgi:uncharacterized membrane protein